MLYDTHAHLNDECYEGREAEVIEAAKAAGLELINNVGFDLASSAKALRQARAFPEVKAVIGIHPHDADQWSEAGEAFLRRLWEEDRGQNIVAIGEIGLDYHFAERLSDEVQMEAFKGQLRLAYELDLPVVIHDREAHQASLEVIEAVKAEGRLRAVPGVFHCYSGSAEFAERLLQLGFYLGFDGPVTYKNGKRPLEVAAAVPADRLLIETDCPYLTPVPYRGRENQPAYLPYIAERIAEARGLTAEELGRLTTANGRRLFAVT